MKFTAAKRFQYIYINGILSMWINLSILSMMMINISCSKKTNSIVTATKDAVDSTELSIIEEPIMGDTSTWISSSYDQLMKNIISYADSINQYGAACETLGFLEMDLETLPKIKAHETRFAYSHCYKKAILSFVHNIEAIKCIVESKNAEYDKLYNYDDNSCDTLSIRSTAKMRLSELHKNLAD